MTGGRFLALFLARRGPLEEGDRVALSEVPTERVVHEDGERIARAGPSPDRSCLLVRGIAIRAHGDPRGGRVVSAISVPGDFMDLHAFGLRSLDHDLVSVGRTVVEHVPHDALRDLARARPLIMERLWYETLVDAKTHRAWIVAGATLTAPQRIAHLMCELELRLERVGLAEANRFTLPLGQRAVADILGYSAVHVNRAVQELRGGGLLEWQGRNVHLPDIERIRRHARFDPGYLEADR